MRHGPARATGERLGPPSRTDRVFGTRQAKFAGKKERVARAVYGENMLTDDQLTTIRAAAEDAAWLCDRGYPASEVAAFISTHRVLDERARALVSTSARADAHHRHHIARELDAEDVERRPVRVDVGSLVRRFAALLAASRDASVVVLESAAGLVLTVPDAPDTSATLRDEAVRELAKALLSLSPASLKLVFEEGDAALASTLRLHLERGRRVNVVEDLVRSVATRLEGATFVVSADPTVLDGAGTWLNLTSSYAQALALGPLKLC